MAEKATLDMMLSTVMSQGNKEQNQSYPPHVFSSHVNLVGDYILDEVAALYPTSKKLEEIADPFMQEEVVQVKGGILTLPSQMRNLLGISIYVSTDFKDPCADCDLPDDPLAPTLEQLKQSLERGKCRSQSVSMVDQTEWDDRTQHPYKFPTLKKPIGCRFKTGEVRICPFEVPNVVVRFIRTPKTYVYGYKMNPDDTYTFDATTSVESEWTRNAFQYLVKGITTLYSIFTRDGELRDGVNELKKAGIF
jgi:hypothetical protein